MALPVRDQALAIVSAELRDNTSLQSDRQQLAAAEAARLYLNNRLTLPDLADHPPAARLPGHRGPGVVPFGAPISRPVRDRPPGGDRLGTAAGAEGPEPAADG